MNITKDAVLKTLSNVDDPDLKKDLVSLNMIEAIEIDGKNITFTIVLTTPLCPLQDVLKNDCTEALKEDFGNEIVVKVNFTSRITTARKTADAVLQGVKNIITVGSGKGGVGKSTVAVNLAIGLAKTGAKVGLIDADIYGPSIPTMMNLEGQRPELKKINGKDTIIPIEQYGVKVLSIGFLIRPEQAVVWRGPMVTSALRQFVTDCEWGELDYLIFDLPPGTGDVQLTLVQTVPVTASIIVTTPQKVAVADVQKAIEMFRLPQINVPVIGLVENMAWFTPAELPGNKYHIFGKGGADLLSKHYDIPVIGRLPLVMGVCEGGDVGVPAILNTDNKAMQNAFDTLVETTARQIAIRNEMMKPTEQVEVREF